MLTRSTRRIWNGPDACEQMEVRRLLSGNALVIQETTANDTLDIAVPLESFDTAQVSGAIDTASDVDWYTFTIDSAASATWDLSAGTLSLYRVGARDFGNRLDVNGVQLLAQVDAQGSAGHLQRDLAPGTYAVAVSALGNHYYNPFLADSGLGGDTTAYELTGSLSDLGSGQGFEVLNVDVSAFTIRLDFNSPLPFAPDLQLLDANGAVVPLYWTNARTGMTELQLAPTHTLAAGSYTVVLKDSHNATWLTVPVNVGASPGALTDLGNDTPATAIDLGTLGTQGLIQASGVIGDDPYYSFGSPTAGLNPGNDVDLYHFQVTSLTPIGFQAEVFAGRIGSPLDAGISLFRLNPTTGHLVFVAGNNQSNNPALGTNLTVPLLTDPTLTVGLTAGDYYLAVSQGFNTRSPLEWQTSPDFPGIFNPEVAHSGQSGFNVGPYVLNVRAVAVPEPPQVVSVSIPSGSVLSEAPTVFTIQFSEYLNLAEQALTLVQQATGKLPIFVTDARGNKYYPRLDGFDNSTLTAQLRFLERLPNGTYQLHLSGSLGLTNLVGNVLRGNSPGGDYVVRFKVAGKPAGTNGNPLVWSYDPTVEDTGLPQDLGMLYPQELTSGISIVRHGRSNSNRAADLSDEYEFSVSQDQLFSFQLTGPNLPAGAQLQLFDAHGNQVSMAVVDNGRSLSGNIPAGRYVLQVGGWSAGDSRGLNYEVAINQLFRHDNPPPLLSGPAPAVGLRLVTAVTSDGSGNGGNTGGTGSSGVTTGTVTGSAPALNISQTATGNPVDAIYALGASTTPRISIPAGQGNMVIALPTVLSDFGSGLNSPLRAARQTSQSVSRGTSLAHGGLIDLADGLVGNRTELSGMNRGNLVSQLNLLDDFAGKDVPQENRKVQATHASYVKETGDSSEETAEELMKKNALKIREIGKPGDKQSPSGPGDSEAGEFPWNPDDMNASDPVEGPQANAADQQFSAVAAGIPTETATQFEVSRLLDTLFSAGVGLLLLDFSVRQRETEEEETVIRRPGLLRHFSGAGRTV